MSFDFDAGPAYDPERMAAEPDAGELEAADQAPTGAIVTPLEPAAGLATEDHVRYLLQAVWKVSRVATLLIVGGPDDIFQPTPAELRAQAAPLTPIINRNARLAAIAAHGDYFGAIAEVGGYAMQEAARAGAYRRAIALEQDQAAAAGGWSSATPADAPGRSFDTAGQALEPEPDPGGPIIGDGAVFDPAAYAAALKRKPGRRS